MIRHFPLTLQPRRKGIYLITEEILAATPVLPKQGLLNVYIQHTSAGLCINENADPDVRHDFEHYMDLIVPTSPSFLKHTIEGPDDMPAHVKSSLVGHSVSIPIVDGRLALGTWQGIYLCEFRERLHQRRVLISIYE